LLALLLGGPRKQERKNLQGILGVTCKLHSFAKVIPHSGSVALVLLTVAFGSLNWVAPANPEQPLFRRWGIRVDLCYWFFTPLVTRAVTRLAIGLVLAAAAIVIGNGATPAGLLAGFGPLSRLPLWGQILVGLTVVDFSGYWVHRLFHGPLWRIHMCTTARPFSTGWRRRACTR
jgi:sterol desaturase/sphingolipid hydroxylase (fatty acid hydroxylase superfamily)